MSSIGRPHTTPPNQSTPATQPGGHDEPSSDQPGSNGGFFPSQPGQGQPPTQPAIRPGVDNLTPTLRLPSTQSSLNTTQPGGDNTPQTPAGLHREGAFR